MIGEFQSVFCVSVFQGLLLVNIIMIDVSKNANVKVAFDLQRSPVFEKCSFLGCNLHSA